MVGNRAAIERFLADHQAQLTEVLQQAAQLEGQLARLSETAFALKGAIAAINHILDLPET